MLPVQLLDLPSVIHNAPEVGHLLLAQSPVWQHDLGGGVGSNRTSGATIIITIIIINIIVITIISINIIITIINIVITTVTNMTVPLSVSAIHQPNAPHQCRASCLLQPPDGQQLGHQALAATGGGRVHQVASLKNTLQVEALRLGRGAGCVEGFSIKGTVGWPARCKPSCLLALDAYGCRRLTAGTCAGAGVRAE